MYKYIDSIKDENKKKNERERIEKQFILVNFIKIIAWPDTARIVLKVGCVALLCGDDLMIISDFLKQMMRIGCFVGKHKIIV